MIFGRRFPMLNHGFCNGSVESPFSRGDSLDCSWGSFNVIVKTGPLDTKRPADDRVIVRRKISIGSKMPFLSPVAFVLNIFMAEVTIFGNQGVSQIKLSA